MRRSLDAILALVLIAWLPFCCCQVRSAAGALTRAVADGSELHARHAPRHEEGHPEPHAAPAGGCCGIATDLAAMASVEGCVVTCHRASTTETADAADSADAQAHPGADSSAGETPSDSPNAPASCCHGEPGKPAKGAGCNACKDRVLPSPTTLPDPDRFGTDSPAALVLALPVGASDALAAIDWMVANEGSPGGAPPPPAPAGRQALVAHGVLLV